MVVTVNKITIETEEGLEIVPDLAAYGTNLTWGKISETETTMTVEIYV